MGDQQEDDNEKVNWEWLYHPVPCYSSEASFETEFLTQTPHDRHTQTQVPGIANSSPFFFLPIRHVSSQEPGTYGGYKERRTAVMSALGELTPKETVTGYGDEGQRGSSEITPEKAHTVQHQPEWNLQEGDGESFVPPPSPPQVHLFAFKARSPMYPRPVTNAQSSFLNPAWDDKVYYHTRCLGYIFEARTTLYRGSDPMVTGVRTLCLTAWAML